MKRIMMVFIILALLSGCGVAPAQVVQSTTAQDKQQTPATGPTTTIRPEPSQDLQATTNAGIVATRTAQPSATPEPMPTQSPKPTLTNTLQAQANYDTFIVKFGANFEALKAKFSSPILSTLQRVEFAKNEVGSSTLWIETTGPLSDITATMMGYTIGVISGLVSTPTGNSAAIAVPEDLEFVRLVFRDENLVEKGHFYTSWTELLDYANKRIEFTDMFRKADWVLP